MDRAKPAELDQYAKQGFFTRQVFSDAEQELREGASSAHQQALEAAKRDDARLEAVVDDPRLFAPCRDLIGCRRVFVVAYQPAELHRWRMGRVRPVREQARSR